MITRRDCLLLSIGVVATAHHGSRRYLLSRQAADGRWHSNTYGLLRSGQSLTPFVLSVVHDDEEAAARGLAFIRRGVNEEGGIGLSDPALPDYPNYSTSLAAQAFLRRGLAREAAPLLAHLRSRQFSAANGWSPGDPAFGAWGMGGDVPRPPFAGHVDLSMTRHCLEALGESLPAEARAAALIFLGRCQNDDGGFCFSTVVEDANKAGGGGGKYRSYGTATADGILALAAAGGPADRIRAAKAWLLRHHRPDAAPGFRGEAFRRWPQGLRYYYAAASAAAFRTLGVPRDEEQCRLLRGEMRPDGSWANPEPLVKEDDPLIATTFALRALAS
jgi:hypothetical protein